MPVYLVVEISRIHDAATYAEYVAKVPAVVAQYGGRYVVRGGPVVSLSGGWQPARVIIVEFQSYDAMGAFTASPEYQKLAPLRETATDTRAIALESYGAS
jgi:uncharacterized protein (DUF1330 family)